MGSKMLKCFSNIHFKSTKMLGGSKKMAEYENVGRLYINQVLKCLLYHKNVRLYMLTKILAYKKCQSRTYKPGLKMLSEYQNIRV